MTKVTNVNTARHSDLIKKETFVVAKVMLLYLIFQNHQQLLKNYTPTKSSQTKSEAIIIF